LIPDDDTAGAIDRVLERSVASYQISRCSLSGAAVPVLRSIS